MRDSIYISKKPIEHRADLLMEYNKDFEEIWSHVPRKEQKYIDLESIVNEFSNGIGMPGLFGIVNYFDVLGTAWDVFSNGRIPKKLSVSHNLGVFVLYTPSWKGNYEHSKFIGCIAEFVAAMEKRYGSAWVIEIKKRSDSIYVKLGFNDGHAMDSDLADPEKSRPGNDIKFLCDCGQYKSKSKFIKNCSFVVDVDGRKDCVGRGFFYNDSSKMCSDYVSNGNGRFFRNMGYVDRGYVSDKHSGYSYYVRARNLDESKVNVLPRIGLTPDKIYEPAYAFTSVEEFAVERAAAGGLKPGDACYLYCVAQDPNGERRSISNTVCWDGFKWIDYYKETEVTEWPSLDPGWKLV